MPLEDGEHEMLKTGELLDRDWFYLLDLFLLLVDVVSWRVKGREGLAISGTHAF